MDDDDDEFFDASSGEDDNIPTTSAAHASDVGSQPLDASSEACPAGRTEQATGVATITDGHSGPSWAEPGPVDRGDDGTQPLDAVDRVGAQQLGESGAFTPEPLNVAMVDTKASLSGDDVAVCGDDATRTVGLESDTGDASGGADILGSHTPAAVRSRSPTPPPRPPTPTQVMPASESSSQGAEGSKWLNRLGGTVFGAAGMVTTGTLSRVGSVTDSVKARVGGVAAGGGRITSVVFDAVRHHSEGLYPERMGRSHAGPPKDSSASTTDGPVSAAALTASYPSSAVIKPAAAAAPAPSVATSYPTSAPKSASKIESSYPTIGTVGSEERYLTLLMELPERNRGIPDGVRVPAGLTVDDMVFASSGDARVLGVEFSGDVEPSPRAVQAAELVRAKKYLLCDPDKTAVFTREGEPLWLTMGPFQLSVTSESQVVVVGENHIYLWKAKVTGPGARAAETFSWKLIEWPSKDRDIPRQLLLLLATMRAPIVYKQPPDPTVGDAVASGIRAGGKGVSSTVVGAATVTSGVLAVSGERARAHIPVKETPLQVSGSTRAAVSKADVAAKQLRGVTSTLVTSVKDGADYAAEKVGPLLADKASPRRGTHSSGGSPSSTRRAAPASGNSRSVKEQAVEVAMASAQAAVEILQALDLATAEITKQVSTQAASTVRHRYGEDAGEVASVAAGAFQNGVAAVREVRGLGVKSTAKRVGKESAKKAVIEYESKREGVAMAKAKDGTDVSNPRGNSGGPPPPPQDPPPPTGDLGLD